MSSDNEETKVFTDTPIDGVLSSLKRSLVILRQHRDTRHVAVACTLLEQVIAYLVVWVVGDGLE